ncbi:hypothetical protein DIPPA_24349 [Diplonema papillatum]|nr:hypothetical protein DIPPA_24349 [Diplonema papillatum]KAJ9450890.1 hypothetical protein DIPPA_24349 [Diplonema papillatum]|eukprot:gene18529-28598_t
MNVDGLYEEFENFGVAQEGLDLILEYGSRSLAVQNKPAVEDWIAKVRAAVMMNVEKPSPPRFEAIVHQWDTGPAAPPAGKGSKGGPYGDKGGDKGGKGKGFSEKGHKGANPSGKGAKPSVKGVPGAADAAGDLCTKCGLPKRDHLFCPKTGIPHDKNRVIESFASEPYIATADGFFVSCDVDDKLGEQMTKDGCFIFREVKATDVQARFTT